MIDTIDYNVMQAAAEALHEYQRTGGMQHVYTVSIELNGAHGGADLTIHGFTGTDVLMSHNVVKLVLP